MNYYNPSFYQNYPYGAGGNQYLGSQMQGQNISQPAPPAINGKIVDTIDMVKVTEVPIGGYGIFPKADFNEIYLKTWNPNGTTSIITFKPLEPPPQMENNSGNQVIEEILCKVKILEEKVDSLLAPIVQQEKVESKQRKEYDFSAI